MPTHQILHRAHPLAAQLRHQTVDIHKVVITDVLNEVVQRDEHARPAHAGTEGEGRGEVLVCAARLHVHQICPSPWYSWIKSVYVNFSVAISALGYLQWTAMVVFSCLWARTALTNLMNVLQDSGTPCSGHDV